MARKKSRRLFGVTLTVALVGMVAVAAANGTTLSRAWQDWKAQSDPNRPYGYATGIRLQTARNHIAVYDTRRIPRLIRSLDIAGEQDLEVRYTRQPGKPSDRLELCSATTKQVLLRLDTNTATQAVVDARWNDLYEVESGSPLNAIPGSVLYCNASTFEARRPALPDLSATPPASSPTTLRVVIRPDMTSPLWAWQNRTAMQAKNGRYYLSAIHPAGVSAEALAVATANHPPRD